MSKDDALLTTKYNDIDPTKFCDTIIDFDSLKFSCTTEKGFNVLFSDKGYENYNKRKNQDAIIVGVIGNANKGKSYILSKISNEELPRGHSVTTKGISVKYPKIEVKPLIILDSAGSEAPLINNMEVQKLSNNNFDIELLTELARDKIATENFIHEFIYFYSNILIVIVGQLTNDDQKLINRIKLMYGNKKNLFIIHNLMFIETIENVNQIIEDTILKSITFNNLSKIKIIGENDEQQNQYYYQEELLNENATIIHLIMAREGSEAGNYYNNSTIQFVRKQIIKEPYTQNFDIIEAFKRYLSNKSGIYMEKPIEIENIIYDENEKKIIINESSNNIILKKCFLNEIGISNFDGKIIEPSYDYIKYENRMEILIEWPGKMNDINTQFNVGGGNYILTFSGTIEFKKDITYDSFLCENFTDGEFRFQLSFAICDGLIKSSKPEKKKDVKNGLYTLIYYYAEKYEGEDIILT